ncbi:hypothetical protein AAZX31_06G219200 [Glycine max]
MKTMRMMKTMIISDWMVYDILLNCLKEEPYFTEEQSFSLGAWWKFLNFVGKLGYIRILN